jgi:hypothetical protein
MVENIVVIGKKRSRQFHAIGTVRIAIHVRANVNETIENIAETVWRVAVYYVFLRIAGNKAQLTDNTYRQKSQILSQCFVLTGALGSLAF